MEQHIYYKNKELYPATVYNNSDYIKEAFNNPV
jgi:hypothetical protein